MRDAVEEVGGSIERIDDPARLGGIALDHPAFLEQHAPVGPGVAKLLDQGLLGALVGHRHEIGRTLLRHLQLLDLVIVAAQARRRLAHGAGHDGDQAGMGNHDSTPLTREGRGALARVRRWVSSPPLDLSPGEGAVARDVGL